jgi:calcineurin-like phosphoesterase family protein
MIRIIAISDTHGFHRFVDIPEGDVFVHAGDITMDGEIETIADFVDWLAWLPHKYKIVVPGNHDRCFDISQTKYDGSASARFDRPRVHLLVDRTLTLEVGTEKLKVYGAPWVPNLSSWAFWDRNYDKFEYAPRDIELLVTHGPPFGIRDDDAMDTHFGSPHIVRYLNRCPMLKAHIFGHVHQGYGMGKRGEILFANAATCDRNYDPVNAPLVIDV